jgi:hypothetical protein
MVTATLDVSPGVVIELPAVVAFSEDLGPTDVRVYMAVSWFLRAGLDRPTQEGIGDLAGVSMETARISLRRLVAAGLVTVDTAATPHLYAIAA